MINDKSELQLWKEILSKDPHSAVAHFQVGVYSLSLNYLSEAVHHFKKATELDPEPFVFWSNLGSVYHLIGKYKLGIAATRKAIEICPYLADIRHNLVNCLLKNGNTKDATTELHSILKLFGDDFQSYFRLGLIYAEAGKFARALEMFQNANRINPNDFEILYNLGAASYDLADYSQAIKYWQQLLTINPYHAQANYRLAKLFAKHQNSKKAIDFLSKAISIDPDYKLLAKENNLFDFVKNSKKFVDLVA